MLAFVRRVFLIVPIAACGLETGGPVGATDAGLEDRGMGMTDSGKACTCVKTPPAGWAFVAYQRDGAPIGCPDDFKSDQVRKENFVKTQPTCVCDCAVDVTSICQVNMVTVNLSDQANCSMATTSMKGVSSSCVDVSNYDPSGPQKIFISGSATYIGGACKKTENLGTADIEIHDGHSCKLTGSLGSGCKVDESCVPNASGGLLQCVEAMGDQMCPQDFPNKHVTSPTYHNDLSCKACSCTYKCTPNVSIWADDQCGGAMVAGGPWPLDGTTCSATNSTNKAHSVKFEKPGEECGKPMGYGNGIQGSFYPEIPFTICCR